MLLAHHLLGVGALDRLDGLMAGVTDWPRDEETTLLHLAVRHSRPAQLDRLLQYGLSLNPLDIDGDTPLDAAITGRRYDHAVVLLERGALWTVPGKPSTGTLHRLAMTVNCQQWARRLLQYATRDDMNNLDDKWSGTTPLILSLEHNNSAVALEFVNAAVRLGADLDLAEDDLDDTCMHVVARKGNCAALQALVEGGGKLDAPNMSGETCRSLVWARSDSEGIRMRAYLTGAQLR
ncbi:MAG: ankyrin repeat domain-containing protein [Phycisphaerales bacterium]|nr:ankyrin repeat domain-containing protein [Phycisphaerales bacterium]